MVGILLQIFAVGVVAFAVITLVLSYLKYERLHEAARSENTKELTPRDAFLLQISGLLGIGRRLFEFVVVCISTPSSCPPMPGLEERIRRHLRRTDIVRLLGEGRAGIIAHTTSEHVPALVERLRAALTAELPEIPFTWGYSSFPLDGETAAALLMAAENRSPTAIPSAAPTPAPAPTVRLDPLTGVLRSEDVDLAVHKYVARCRREGEPVSLIYADVAGLKMINERYGSKTGDAILRNFARVLERTLREDDLIGRIGDDDFLVAAACAPSGAACAAERVLRAVREDTVNVGTAAIHYAVHIGIAGHPDHGGSPRALFTAAECALAAARRKGRDTAVIYTPSLRGLSGAEGRSRDRF